MAKRRRGSNRITRQIITKRRLRRRGAQRGPRVPVPTPEQLALHDRLQGPVDMGDAPPTEVQLRVLVETLTRQRDDALQTLSDRANVQMTVSRLGAAVLDLRTAVEETLRLARAVKAENRRLQQEEDEDE